MKMKILKRLRHAGTLGVLIAFALSAAADSGSNHRGVSSLFGTSGGNINDISTLYCCSGTLGSLVQDDLGKQYILSNNHVLARSNSGNPGDDISQPGLIDNFCQVPTVVADLTAFPSLKSSNVDAAIALSRGIMNTTGEIMDIGTISSVVRVPSIGMILQKSARTTGHTTGPVSSINTTVSVQYQPICGMGKKFKATFRNQVVVNSSTFSAGGDSGSLMLSVPTDGGKPQPVALLFAGSSTSTIGNPIGQVLSAVSQSLGRPVTFVGSSTVSPAATTGQSGGSAQSIQQANSAKERWEDAFMARPNVIGVGVGTTEDGSDAAVIVYVDNSSAARPALPARADAVPVRIVFTDPFVSR
jgi:hypothetical protein